VIVGGSIAVEFFAEACTMVFVSAPTGCANLLHWRTSIVIAAIFALLMDGEATVSAGEMFVALHKQ